MVMKGLAVIVLLAFALCVLAVTLAALGGEPKCCRLFDAQDESLSKMS